MGFFSSFFSCNDMKNSEPILPYITKVQEQEEGFNDISLKIIEVNKKENNYEYIAKGKYENKIVGIKISIQNNISAGINNNGEIEAKSFEKNGIIIESIGAESDNFVTALSQIYNIPRTTKFSKNPIKTTIFPLNQTVADLTKSNYYKFKVFFNDESDENEYAEIYININLENNYIEFNEKDNEYRINIIKTLEGK